MALIDVAEVSFLQRSAAGPVRVWAVAADDEHIESLGRTVTKSHAARDFIWNSFEVQGPAGVALPAPAPSIVFVVATTNTSPDLADTNCAVSILDVYSSRQTAEAVAAAEREFEPRVAVIEFPVNALLFS